MFGLKALIGEGLLFVVVVVGGWAVGGDGGGDGMLIYCMLRQKNNLQFIGEKVREGVCCLHVAVVVSYWLVVMRTTLILVQTAVPPIANRPNPVTSRCSTCHCFFYSLLHECRAGLLTKIFESKRSPAKLTLHKGCFYAVMHVAHHRKSCKTSVQVKSN